MASLWKHKQHGYKITYTLYYIDGTQKEKYRYARKEKKAILIHQDAKRLEVLTLEHRLTHEELVYFLHKKLVDAEEVAKLTSRAQSKHLEDPAGITWEKLQHEYDKHVYSVGSKSTRASYSYKTKPIIEYFKNKGIAPWQVNSPQIIQDYITHRRTQKAVKTGAPITKSTVNKEITALRIMLDYLVRKKILSENPARTGVKRFKEVPARAPRAIHPDDLQIIMHALDNYNGEAAFGYFSEIIYTYIYTGMRRYELLYLQPDNVDLRSGLITVHGKGDKFREIEIHPNLVPHIESVIRKNSNRKGKYFFGRHDTPLMDPNSLYRAFKKFIAKLKLPGWITLHILRHTWTSYLMDSGVPPHKVQQQAGHESITTTMKYTHRVPGSSRAIDTLDYKKYMKKKESATPNEG
ncbi:MAG: tyrosine-type recombinase/integrase [Nitrospirota bacterium]